MNFDLSEEQRMLQQALGQLLDNECDATRRRAIFDGDDDHDPALWKHLAELGIAGMHLPEAFGGAGLELLDLAAAAETLGRHATPGPFLGNALAGLAIARGGSDAQRERWLPALASGDAIGSIAFAEGEGRWLPEQWTLAGGASLQGDKAYVPAASAADVLVVGVAGGGLMLVERDASGVTVEPIEGADRTRRLFRVRFDGAQAEALPEGASAAPAVRDAGLVLLAADAYGGAWRLVEDSVAYAKTREQFGVVIGQFQALKHQLANMAVKVEPTRALCWYAAHAFDRVPDEAERMAALAKAHVTDRYMEVARDAVEAHGGIGFTWECDVQIWFKRAMFDRAFLGTPAVHRERSAQLAGW